MRRRKSTANFMDQRQTQKSIQHAVKRVMELSSLKRTTRNLAEVIEQAMAECNSRASRDSNFAHLTSEQLQRAHEMHLKLCEKAGLKETPRSRRRSRAAPETTVSVSVASTSFLLIFGRLVSARLHAHRRRRMTRKNSRPPSVRDRENKREAEERYAAEEMLGMHAGACHLRDSPPEDREFALDMLVARAAALARAFDFRARETAGARDASAAGRELGRARATRAKINRRRRDRARDVRSSAPTRFESSDERARPVRSRRPTSGSGVRWAETVRELKKDRVRNERAIEKSWLMMEEEKRLDALSPRLRICSLSVMAWAQYVRLNKLARRKAVVQANARALNAVRKLRARNTKMCALQNLVASAVAKKDKKRQVARHLKKAAAAHFAAHKAAAHLQAVFSANHADDRFQNHGMPKQTHDLELPELDLERDCGYVRPGERAEPAQALRSFHGKISYRGKWGGPSPKPKPPEAAAPPDFDDASFVSFRGTVDRPLGLGGRVPPWLACGDDDDESLPSCVSPLARPAIVPPSLPVAPPSSSAIPGRAARAAARGAASSVRRFFSPLAAAIAVETALRAPAARVARRRPLAAF
ncbi:hypothetical protein JL721_6837 [Aureococcus anophagefferens]|nr:hypothetical protein JL721_6837 [Aureococcus anophagefferens]